MSIFFLDNVSHARLLRLELREDVDNLLSARYEQRSERDTLVVSLGAWFDGNMLRGVHLESFDVVEPRDEILDELAVVRARHGFECAEHGVRVDLGVEQLPLFEFVLGSEYRNTAIVFFVSVCRCGDFPERCYQRFCWVGVVASCF